MFFATSRWPSPPPARELYSGWPRRCSSYWSVSSCGTPPRASRSLFHSRLKMASATVSFMFFLFAVHELAMRLSMRHAAGIASSSVTPARSVFICLAWWIMYMIQVPTGSTSTCAPSRSRNLNMLKLPSPSVVCAQNSPVILTSGLTRVRSISTSSIFWPRSRNAFW